MQIDPNQFQVFLFSSPCSVLFFSAHPWFVVNNRGAVSRWEVLRRQKHTRTGKKHLYLNHFEPFQGTEMIPYLTNFLWQGKLLGRIEGDAARPIVELIERSASVYPFCDEYALPGPNSNTYAQWVLDQFPEFKVDLPWNAYGKSYQF